MEELNSKLNPQLEEFETCDVKPEDKENNKNLKHSSTADNV